MKKSSRLFWFLVLAQACAVALAIELQVLREPPPHGRLTAAYADIRGGLKTSLDTFANDCGRYPTTVEGFQALITCPANISQKRWKGPYLDPHYAPPLDPWGRAYVYRCPGIHNADSYDLYSTGPDGLSKSDGDDPDDIHNWPFNSAHAGSISTGDGDPFFEVVPILLIIPLACGVCSVTKNYSPRARDYFDRNHNAYFVWIVTSLIALMMFLSALVPRVSG